MNKIEIQSKVNDFLIDWYETAYNQGKQEVFDDYDKKFDTPDCLIHQDKYCTCWEEFISHKSNEGAE